MKSETAETHFSMFIACGPFTPEADLAYRPLQNLVSKLKEAKPAVVLLVRPVWAFSVFPRTLTRPDAQTGPFIDATHPAIKVGDVDATPREMFQAELVNRLRDFLDASPGSTILLVPSTRDILSDHAVFPQCELPRALCNDPVSQLAVGWA